MFLTPKMNSYWIDSALVRTSAPSSAQSHSERHGKAGPLEDHSNYSVLVFCRPGAHLSGWACLLSLLQACLMASSRQPSIWLPM